MKNIIYLIGIIISLASLSSCGGSDGVNPNTEKKVLKMTMYRYYNGVLEGDPIVVTFENNKPTHFFYGKGEENIYYNEYYVYNENGLLTSAKTYNIDGELTIDRTIKYDFLGRIIEIDEDAYNHEVYTITYNSDNTITSSNGSYDRIFHLNENGLVYQRTSSTDPDPIQQVKYNDENNPIEIQGYSYATSITYDEVNVPKGIHLTYWENIFGDYKPNAVLYDNNISLSLLYRTKYITSLKNDNYNNSPGWTIERSFTFDEEGYPTKAEEFVEDVLIEKVEYEYEQ